MALDASKGNRANEMAYNLIVDFGQIYNTNNVDEIRKVLATDIVLMDKINSMSNKEIQDLKSKVNDLLLLDDLKLKEKKVKMTENLKMIWRPEFEVFHYHFTDKKIYIAFRNIKAQVEDSFNLKWEGSLDALIDEYEKKVDELKKNKKKDSASLKLKLELLKQVKQQESNK